MKSAGKNSTVPWKKYSRTALDLERRAADTKSRASAPQNRSADRKSKIAIRKSHAFGILADPGRFFIAAQRTGMIHFSV